MNIDPHDFGVSFKGFLDQMSSAAPAEEPVFRRRLREHFEQDPSQLPTLTEKFPSHDHVNVHMALESELAGDDGSVEVLGVTSPHQYMPVSLSMLASPAKAALMGGGEVSEGPIEYVNLTVDNERVMPCVQRVWRKNARVPEGRVPHRCCSSC